MTTTQSKRRILVVGVTAGVLVAGGLGVGTAYAASTYFHPSQPVAARSATQLGGAGTNTNTNTATGGDPAPAAGQNAAGNTGTPVANGIPVSATSIPTTPQAYAKEAFEAWRTQQTARLRQLTTAASYKQFQSIPRQTSGRVWYFSSCCDAGAGQIYCTFAAYPTGDTVVVHLPNGPSTAHGIVARGLHRRRARHTASAECPGVRKGRRDRFQ
ncbi:hypothetical protein [Fodinicola feengrottensis]|uniref:hypothetical protein n=1 Tax=Fodinicola feengrottensis TaxID=435914 RepID=UPI0013D5710F|nr:hypothetical protein [Fodinicola feengrottensis]